MDIVLWLRAITMRKVLLLSPAHAHARSQSLAGYEQETLGAQSVVLGGRRETVEAGSNRC